ncbi:MAG: MotA/TolQ/ExbB proton channel family protein [Anaerohalosphaera sp.]|nr:MotA/TolQ/ExbB proton channel family protein [Anaerohalosphaera sp.]
MTRQQRVSGFALAAIVMMIVISSTAFAETDSAGVAATPRTFFSQFIIAGGYIVWLVLIPMSLATVYLVFDLCMSLRRKTLLPDHAGADIESIARTTTPEKLTEMLMVRQDLVSRVIVRIITKSQHLKPDRRYIDHLAAEALNEQAVMLLRKIEWCNIIGNVAPMVGLFGTVFGMIKAFNVLGISAAQPRPDMLAAAISEALVTTFWGLLIAIPSLAMHGVFRSRTEAMVSEAAIEIETLMQQITLPGVTVPERKKTHVSSDTAKLKRVISRKMKKPRDPAN